MMNRYLTFPIVICLLQLLAVYAYAQPAISSNTGCGKDYFQSLKNTHDMALPAWGPYSTNYNGISHVPDENNGFRFDVIVQPSYYLRNLTVLGNTQRESGYHPWKAATDLSFFSYRYELEWKDRVYCEVSYSKVDETSRLIRAEFVNNTSVNKSLALNIFSTIVSPYKKVVKAGLASSGRWRKAADYVSLTDSIIPPNYNLVYNGQPRGQQDDDDAVSHTSIITSPYSGEVLLYKFPNSTALKQGKLVFRYKCSHAEGSVLQVTINNKTARRIYLKQTREYALADIDVGDLSIGNITLSLKTVGKPPVTLDGFTLAEKAEASQVVFKEVKFNAEPQKFAADIPNAAIFKFDDIKEFYGLVWRDSSADKRSLLDDNPDAVLSKFDYLVKAGDARLHNGRIKGNRKGWFENIFFAPIIVKPGESVSKYAYIVCGNSAGEVAQKLRSLNTKWHQVEETYHAQQCNAISFTSNKAGQPYVFSQQLMAATTMTNLIYPAFLGNKFVKHTTPGKRWSSFYTWDAGFIGLGFAKLNLDRAVESLNAYTMDVSEQSAFLEHGTPLPVQGYLFNELWNETQNVELLKYFYPRVKRYYAYLGGAENSPTRKLKSNLLQTWDIFYNSGGWDDYAPQVYTHKQRLEKDIAPTINTSHQIRLAKMLKMAAWQLGYVNDVKEYDKDIAMYGDALQQHAWDETSGYFGYVMHRNDGTPSGILKYSLNVNFNMGLDGCSPLIAGICTPAQRKMIISHLFTKGKLWTDQGITAIDQSAPYYNKDGYWNGRVWMPHQWFIWKTMLDLNEPDKAIQIAQTALNLWKRETDETYNCWENFSVEAGNGGGWHQFGALSSPVLNWFSALYKPGTITYGFNVWPIVKKFNTAGDSFEGVFKWFADKHTSSTAMLLCLNDKYNYQATCNNKRIPLRKVIDGLYVLEINFPKNGKDVFKVNVTRY